MIGAEEPFSIPVDKMKPIFEMDKLITKLEFELRRMKAALIDTEDMGERVALLKKRRAAMIAVYGTVPSAAKVLGR